MYSSNKDLKKENKKTNFFFSFTGAIFDFKCNQNIRLSYSEFRVILREKRESREKHDKLTEMTEVSIQRDDKMKIRSVYM